MDLFSILNFDATFAGKFKPVIKKAMVELEGNNRCMSLTIVVIINWQCCIKTFNYKFHGFSWSWIFFCICLRCTFQEICIRAGGMGHQESIFQSRYIFSSTLPVLVSSTIRWQWVRLKTDNFGRLQLPPVLEAFHDDYREAYYIDPWGFLEPLGDHFLRSWWLLSIDHHLQKHAGSRWLLNQILSLAAINILIVSEIVRYMDKDIIHVFVLTFTCILDRSTSVFWPNGKPNESYTYAGARSTSVGALIHHFFSIRIFSILLS